MKPHTVSSPRPRKDGKTFWHRVGVAWPREDGGFKLDLDSLPLPDAEGKVTLLVSPPREQEAPRNDPARQAPAQDGAGRPSDEGDAIPFAPEWRV